MKKKYTIVYTSSPLDRYNTRITRFKHIETEDLVNAVKKDPDIGDWSAVWFVFDGHCQTTDGL